MVKSQIWDFPGGSVNKNSPADTGNTDLIPSKTPHALEPLSPCTTATGPVVLQLLKSSLQPVLPNKRSHRSEKPAYHSKEECLLTATRESPLAATKTRHSQQ